MTARAPAVRRDFAEAGTGRLIRAQVLRTAGVLPVLAVKLSLPGFAPVLVPSQRHSRSLFCGCKPGKRLLTAPPLPGHAVQALGQVTHPAGQPIRGHAGPLVRLPGRISLPAAPGPVLAGRVEGTLGRAEAVLGGIEGAFGQLHRGQGIAERVLRRGQPVAQLRELPDRLPALPRPVCHPTIIAGRGSHAPTVRARVVLCRVPYVEGW